jgi:hypothetical protein
LAVAHEVLCNAWKVHIGAGITLTSFIITVTELKIVIPDFGSGIHHYIMGAAPWNLWRHRQR